MELWAGGEKAPECKRDALLRSHPGQIVAALEQRRAGEREHEQRHVAVDVAEEVQELERALVGPVQILEQQHDRRHASSGAAPQHLRGHVKRAVPELAEWGLGTEGAVRRSSPWVDFG